MKTVAAFVLLLLSTMIGLAYAASGPVRFTESPPKYLIRELDSRSTEYDVRLGGSLTER
jgi:hypothetical protein